MQEATRKVEAEELACFLPIFRSKQQRLIALEKEAVLKGVHFKLDAGEDATADVTEGLEVPHQARGT